ncbi:MAG: hypothetical protein IJ781_01210 [Atopobiaceae bacterium]|nr:hypothetical protein [Atopobiaceae bacterium]
MTREERIHEILYSCDSREELAERIATFEELVEALRCDWDIEASWDGLRHFWYVGLTEEGVRKRDEAEREHAVTGDTSDGYHTFNELYHHRAVLFSVIVRDHPELAWKSKAHHDGSMYEGMFIVGVETPDGQATYHYDIDPYWEMFDCKELERAPEWDGHTPDEAIERIATLGRGTCKIHDCEGSFSAVNRPVWRCDCGAFMTQYTDATTYHKPRFCPNCGRKVVSE